MQITADIEIPDNEIELTAIRAQGAGGQNINKVSTAIHLRFDINASSLPDECKEKLRQLADRRISNDDVIIIKAQRYRSQDKNRADARAKLQALIATALVTARKRIPTRPTKCARKKRLELKNRRGELKALRSKLNQ